MSTQSNLHFNYYFLFLFYLTPSDSHIMSQGDILYAIVS